MTDTEKTYVADIKDTDFAAVQRHARKLRAQAVGDAGRAVGAWFKGLTSSTSGARSPRGGRTA